MNPCSFCSQTQLYSESPYIFFFSPDLQLEVSTETFLCYHIGNFFLISLKFSSFIYKIGIIITQEVKTSQSYMRTKQIMYIKYLVQHLTQMLASITALIPASPTLNSSVFPFWSSLFHVLYFKSLKKKISQILLRQNKYKK